MDDDIQVEAAPLDVLAQPASGVSFFHCPIEAMSRAEILAPNVNVGLVAPDRVGSDQHALEKCMRVALEDVSILESPRLPFVGVDDQILGLRTTLWDERPFSSCRKPGSAQTAKVGPRDLVYDLRRRHRERLPGCGVTFVRDVSVPPGSPCVLEPRREHWSIGRDKGLRLVDQARA